MTAFIERVMTLWSGPAPATVEAFGTCYAPTLTVNGVPFTLDELVARARALQAAYSDISHEVLQVVETPGFVVVAFLLHVRHTGTLTTPLGPVPPTGRTSAARTIDILTVRDGLITDITVVSDEFGLLNGLGALTLT